jgi:REP element-mobilizing transposase RayT
MILAYHLVWTAYGWWFPNDPRGSWSEEIWNPRLTKLPATGKNRARGRRPVQPTPAELQKWLQKAQQYLKYPPVLLDGKAREIASNAIKEQVRIHGYEVPAIAIMSEHVHVVIKRHIHKYERIVQAFKSVSSRALRKHLRLAALPARRSRRDSCKSGCATRAAGSTAKREGAEGKPAEQLIRVPIWSRGYWVRYLDTEKAITPAVAYVDRQDSPPY